MGRESTQRLFNALLVSDIRIDFIKDGKGAAVQSRNVKAGLSHQREQAYGLQRNGFTAGVWSGDDQQVKIFPEGDVDGNDLLFVDQRMAGFSQMDLPFRIEDRLISVLFHGERSAGENEIQSHHIFQIIAQGFQMFGNLLAQFGENDLDLFFLLQLQFADIIVQFYDSHRLDEDGGAGGRLVVDHARNLALVF